MAAEPGLGPEGAAASEFAPAKVNLYLHVRGRREDGYHLLDSLAVFPRTGDRLWAEPGPGLSLSVSGPFADALGAGPDNLVLRAAEALARRRPGAARAALHLEKILPVASGIGGGSSDAGAALRLLSRLWGCPVPEDLALALGADVPVCLAARPARMEGAGERLSPAPRLPGCWMVLANPGVAVPTGRVFAALDCRENPPGPPPPATGFDAVAPLVDWLRTQRNDLEGPAVACCPAIGDVLEALSDAPLARMSGSGATCFALWPGEAEALAQADRLRRARPGWWVAAAPVPAAALAPV